MYVYLAYCPKTDAYVIGSNSNVADRVKQLNASHQTSWQFVMSLDIPNTFSARRVKAQWHAKAATPTFSSVLVAGVQLGYALGVSMRINKRAVPAELAYLLTDPPSDEDATTVDACKRPVVFITYDPGAADVCVKNALS